MKSSSNCSSVFVVCTLSVTVLVCYWSPLYILSSAMKIQAAKQVHVWRCTWFSLFHVQQPDRETLIPVFTQFLSPSLPPRSSVLPFWFLQSPDWHKGSQRRWNRLTGNRSKCQWCHFSFCDTQISHSRGSERHWSGETLDVLYPRFRQNKPCRDFLMRVVPPPPKYSW